jgi:hypothetical protein
MPEGPAPSTAPQPSSAVGALPCTGGALSVCDECPGPLAAPERLALGTAAPLCPASGRPLAARRDDCAGGASAAAPACDGPAAGIGHGSPGTPFTGMPGMPIGGGSGKVTLTWKGGGGPFGKKLLASSMFSRTGNGGIWLIMPCNSRNASLCPWHDMIGTK